MSRLRAERGKGRSDFIYVGEEDEYEVGDEGPTRGNGISNAEIAFFLGEDPDEILFAKREQERVAGVVKERNLTADDILRFDKAKLKEFEKVLYEKRAVRLLTHEESTWVKSQHPERILSSMFALKWKEDLEEPETELEAKARWAIRGCDDPDLKELGFAGKTQAPTLSIEARHLIYQLCASYG